MAAIQFVEESGTFERVGKEEDIQALCEVFNVVMKVGCFFLVVEYEYVINIGKLP